MFLDSQPKYPKTSQRHNLSSLRIPHFSVSGKLLGTEFNLFKNTSLDMITGLCWDELFGMDSVNYSEQSKWTNQCNIRQPSNSWREIDHDQCLPSNTMATLTFNYAQSVNGQRIDRWMDGRTGLSVLSRSGISINPSLNQSSNRMEKGILTHRPANYLRGGFFFFFFSHRANSF